jgi:ankyrin repeat protein
LHYAAYSGEKRIVEYLVNKAADTQAKNVDGKIPINLVPRHSNDRKEIFRILRKAPRNKHRIMWETAVFEALYGRCNRAKELLAMLADKTADHPRRIANYHLKTTT